MDSKKCRTTVVIPNYNGIKYIEACLDMLLTGSLVPQIIVVDNASTDGSRELIEQKYGTKEEIRLICLAENTGFCHAVNVGIAETRTEYVFLLNNDTEADCHCVEELEKMMDKHPNAFSAGAKMINLHFPEKIDDAGDFYNALGWAFARGKDKPVTRYEKEGRVFASCAGAALYRKDVFDEIGLFDENHFAYLEDIDIGYRANIWGYCNLFAPNAHVYHAGSAVSGSRHNPFKVNLSARNSIYLIYKNMPFLQILFNLPFLVTGYLIKLLFFARKGMGRVYVKAVLEGVKLSASDKGKVRKVRFRWKHFANYLWIQWELWLGLVRRFF